MQNLWKIKNNLSYTFEIKKSKFISLSFYVENESEINSINKALKEKYCDATHICYAYKLANNKEKYFDDNEPQGTAGKPILNVISKNNLTNIAIFVIRYFGGIKLGAGGLLRAYTQSAKELVKISELVQINNVAKIKFDIEKNEFTILEKIKNMEILVDYKIDFGEKTCVNLIVEQTELKNIENIIENLLSRKVDFEIIENQLY